MGSVPRWHARRRAITLILVCLLLTTGCSEREAQSVARDALSAAFGTVKVANTGGEGVFVRRTPRLNDRIKAWPDGTLLVVVGPDAQGEGGTWKNVLDPANNVGFVPARYVTVVSEGNPERVAQLAGEQVERWARETAERAVREAIREGVGEAPAGYVDWLLSKLWGTSTKTAQKPAGNPLRVAVLLPGIGTDLDASTNGKDNPSLGQVYQFLTEARAYDDVIFYSYNCGSAARGPSHPTWSPASYAHTDTHTGFDTHATQLQCLVTAYQNAAGVPVSFHLVGHSLGGAVALHYLRQGGGNVGHLVTLDSPVNGSGDISTSLWTEIKRKYELALSIGTLPDREKHEKLRRMIQAFESPVASELREQGKDQEKTGKENTALLGRLKMQGMKVSTYGNTMDIVVTWPDSAITPSYRSFDSGDRLDGRIWLWEVGLPWLPPWTMGIEDWLMGAERNHGLIARVLDQTDNAKAIRAALCEDLEFKCKSR